MLKRRSWGGGPFDFSISSLRNGRAFCRREIQCRVPLNRNTDIYKVATIVGKLQNILVDAMHIALYHICTLLVLWDQKIAVISVRDRASLVLGNKSSGKWVLPLGDEGIHFFDGSLKARIQRPNNDSIPDTEFVDVLDCGDRSDI